MKLYRARPLTERPTRHPAFHGNGPEHRVRGRWYTSDIKAARHHGESKLCDVDWEIVIIDIADEIAETHRVATTPYTRCGLSPIEHSQSPETDFIIPWWRAMDAIAVTNEGEVRQRDYLWSSAWTPKSKMVVQIAEDLGLPVIEVKMAA